MIKRAHERIKAYRLNEDGMLDFEKKEPYCDLLCLMFEHRIIAPENKDRVTYLVKALLSGWKWSELSMGEPQFGKLVLHNLLQRDLLSYKEIRDAGASLRFLRFLDAPDEIFCKNGMLDCNAQMVKSAMFNLEWCLQRGFGKTELVEAGFKPSHVDHMLRIISGKSDHESLRDFGKELFEMQFSVSSLIAMRSFDTAEIFHWFYEHKPSFKKDCDCMIRERLSSDPVTGRITSFKPKFKLQHTCPITGLSKQ